MIKKHYSANSKRALNIIWNAAGSYDFEPPFQAFYANGKPDFYFNMIIGLCYKWLDLNKIEAFIDSYSSSRKSNEYDEYIWLGLENCLYEKELPDRPMMQELRLQRAEAFFTVQKNLSRQQMAMMSIPVYNQQQARWSEITGRKPPLLSEKEKQMSEALKLSGSLETDELLSELSRFLSEFCNFRFSGESSENRHHKRLLKKLWGKRVQGNFRKAEHLIVKSGTGTGDESGAVHLNQEGWLRNNDPAKEARDRAYIEKCFGPCIYSDTELRMIESDLCRDADEGMKLWFTRPQSASSEITAEKTAPKTSFLLPKQSGDGTDVREDMLKQYRKNREYYNAHSLQIRESIRKLSAEIEVLVSSWLQHLPEASRYGRISPEKAYRLPLLNDANVFFRSGDEAENMIRVDLLLDASQSRMNSQEIIAAEACIISESLEKAGIPVQVLSFRSLRGYTVLERMKSYHEKTAEGILHYYVAGWNRDALAFRATEFLIREELKKKNEQKHILLILTDASPNDSSPIGGSSGWSKPYEGLVPVKKAAEAVRSMETDHIRTAAVFHGAASHLENVYQIYGNEYIHIHSLAQLAGSLTDLLSKIFSEIEAD